jgi:small-conductance mechanosensitive channel
MFPFDYLSLELMLPFFLVLAITYGALEVSKVFANRAVKAILAVVFAFFAILNSQVVTFINSILPYAAVSFVVIFLIWIVLKPIRGDGKDKKGIDPVLIIVVLVLILVVLARLQMTDYFPSTSVLSNENIIWIVGIIIVAYILWKAFKMGPSGSNP